jgi:uncharacterized protein
MKKYIILMLSVLVSSAFAQKKDSKTVYKPGKNIISFDSGGIKIIGHLYIPKNFDASKKYTAVIFDGPMTGLKDQVVGLYANEISNSNILSLVYDHSYYGESEGMPRQLENPEKKVADNKNALTYLLSIPFVDKNKTVGIGICAGAGIMSKTVSIDNRYRAYIGVARYYNDSTGVSKKTYAIEQIKKGNEAKEKFLASNEVDYIPAVWSDYSEKKAAMSGWEPTNEPFSYYGTKRGYSPFYVNRVAVESFIYLMNFDVMRSAEKIKTPVLIIHGKTDLYCTPKNAQKFYDTLNTKKELFWIETTNHIDLYDEPKYTTQAIDKIISWLEINNFK